MKKGLLVASVMSVLLFSGCSYVNVEKSDLSVSASKYTTTVDIIPNKGKRHIIDSVKLDNDLSDFINKKCLPKGHEIGNLEGSTNNGRINKGMVAPVLTTFLTATGKHIYDNYMKNKMNELSELKESLNHSYNFSIDIKNGDLKDTQCVLIRRVKKEDKNNDFVALVKLNKSENKYFTMEPIYVKANNTVAFTKKIEDNEDNKISASIAISLKTIEDSKNMPSVKEFGSEVVSVPNIILTKDAICTKSDCKKSNIIPYLKDDNAIISATFAITETGTAGFKIPQKEAELKALDSAMGPAVKSSIEKLIDSLIK
jgi:hypothetical protein